MLGRAVTVVSLLVIVGLVTASGPLGVGSGAIAATQHGVTISESSPDASVSGTAAAQPPLAIGDDRFDRTLFEITIYENRSAQWRFQFTQRLDNETEAANFETYAAEFRENETDLYRQFVAGGRELTRTGSNVTGREMNATGFSRDAYTGTLDNLGIVEMSFIWTNFGQPRDGGGVLVGDVFEGGLAINVDQRLRIVAGPSLTLETDSIEPLPANTSVQSLAGEESVEWVGEFSFADQRPRVAFSPIAAETTTASNDRTTSDRTATTTAPSGPTTADPETETPATTVAADGPIGGFGLAGMLVGLAVMALVVVVVTWRRGYFDVRDGDGSPGDGGDAGGSGGIDDGGQTAGGPEATTDTTGSAVAEAALVSDDDRVRQLLEDNGGRMKQTKIVEATEWSKSKVSMLLSEMEDDGEVTKLRVGRENIVSLPGAEPDAARSPFEDLDEE